MIKLGVNIDHIATIRNARGEDHPDIIKAAKFVSNCGADIITIHRREDERHINRKDVIKLKKKIIKPINLEMAANQDMLRLALKIKPKYVCIVPEKRMEVTTEGGLNLKKNIKVIKNIIKKLKSRKIRTSLFIEPDTEDIRIAKYIDADCIEIHTGKICKLFEQKKNTSKEFARIKQAVSFANMIGLEVHAGHGITFDSAKLLSKIKGISEFNIGHFIIGESIFIGIKDSIKQFKKIFKK